MARPAHLPSKTTSPINVCSIENYLYEPQDTAFKRTTLNFIKNFKKFKNDINT